MKRISTRKESRRTSTSKPAPSGPLQYFTYDDVAPAAEPKVGDFPKHGDTVALGDAEQEAEIARSRASRRISQTVDARDHEDIFANAPEEPLAPEEPRGSRRDSRRGSRRSSRRVSRRSSMDGSLGPASSRNSRPISPERDGANGYTSRSRRDSATGRQTSYDASNGPAEPEVIAATSASRHIAPEPTLVPSKSKSKSPALAKAPTDPPSVATHSAANASTDHSLSQVPTAEDMLSRVQTRVSSGVPSRQSTRGGDLAKRTSIMTTGSTKSKSKRQSKQSSKPEPLKYFTYDDVAPAKPPVFGQVPHPDGESSKRESRSIKGKEREFIGDQDMHGDGRATEDAPQVPELPQKLAHMDLSGTGLTRSSTRDTAAGRGGRRESQRISAAAAGPANVRGNAGGVDRSSTRVSYTPGQEAALTASHGLDFTDIPGPGTGRRAPAPPPPVNMSNKPAGKRSSREPRSRAHDEGMAATAAGAGVAVAAASAAAAAAAGPTASPGAENASKPARTSSFQEQLPEALRHGGVRENAVQEAAPVEAPDTAAAAAAVEAPVEAAEPVAELPAPVPVSSHPTRSLSMLDKTKMALGLSPAPEVLTQPPQEQSQALAPPKTPLTAGGNQDTGFVSAPSSPTAEKGPFLPPAAPAGAGAVEAHEKGKQQQQQQQQQQHATATGRQIREERLTRQVYTYNVDDPSRPNISVEILSKRYFMQLDDGRFVEVVERDVPSSISSASAVGRPAPPSVLPSREHLSSQNI